VQRVQALPHWQRVDFISDVHLQASEPATAQAWEHYLSHCTADALFILGDLFEVWVGDDILAIPPNTAPLPGQAFAQECAQALRELSCTTPVYVMHGNRDFLLGAGFAQHTGCNLLDDPCTLEFGSLRYLLTHGDAWCLSDTAYQAFRAKARTAAWQEDFLAQPLAARLAMAEQMREQSEVYKAQVVAQGEQFADVDEATALHALEACDSRVLIHGHTHQPATHALGQHAQRVVLSDWDAEACPARLQVLSLNAQGGIERHPLRV
jgi:UDP-2,3-diacylglucosamine hydrolase